MSVNASGGWDRTWGHKSMFGSAFADISRDAIDVALDHYPEGEDKAFARMSAAALKLALLDAEAEAKDDPDSLGPDQDALLVAPRGEDDIDMIDLHCQVLGLNAAVLRDMAGTVLDIVADRVRAARDAAPSAEVICIAEARIRREAAVARDTIFASVPVLSRRGGHVIGHQLAMGF